MKKQARLVTVSITTRVVVNYPVTDGELAEAAKKGILEKIHNNEVLENITQDTPDLQMPAEEEEEFSVPGHQPAYKEEPNPKPDTYYQPEIDEFGEIVGHPGESIWTWEVYRSKERMMADYPKCNPMTYHGNDIEDPGFID